MEETNLIRLALLVFGILYARHITLSPFPARLMWLSIVVGVTITNLGLGLILALRLDDPAWLWWPHLYFAAGGLLALLLYRFHLYLGWMPEEFSQTWAFVVVGCLPPLVVLSIHVYLDSRLAIALSPVICYGLTGGPMVLAQDLKWRLQRANGSVIREVIQSHRAEREKIIYGD